MDEAEAVVSVKRRDFGDALARQSRTAVQCAFQVALAILLGAAAADGQDRIEIDECVGGNTTFCYDSPVLFEHDECGVQFQWFQGTVSWPVLRNVGPVTISVLTRNFPQWTSPLPLYIEVRRRTTTQCSTSRGGILVLIAQGGTQCGGGWESFGPIDLSAYGVPMGSLYSVQVLFLRFLPSSGVDTVGFACLKVRPAESAISSTPWSSVKRLYR